MKVFYYKFDWLNAWFVLNAVLLIMIAHCFYCCPCLIYWWQTQVIIGTVLFSVLVWCWKYVFKHKMAVVTDDDITIDCCKPLKWKDIASAEQKDVRCWFKNYKVIVLNPKTDIKYQYNFLQKHNCGFTPFSIPLYGIVSEQDIDELKKIIKEKVKKTDF